MTSFEQRTTVAPKEGLHARPAAQFVSTAKQFVSEIVVMKDDGQQAQAKSTLKLMTLGAKQGDGIVVRAEGEDAEAAVTALVELISAE